MVPRNVGAHSAPFASPCPVGQQPGQLIAGSRSRLAVKRLSVRLSPRARDESSNAVPRAPRQARGALSSNTVPATATRADARTPRKQAQKRRSPRGVDLGGSVYRPRSRSSRRATKGSSARTRIPIYTGRRRQTGRFSFAQALDRGRSRCRLPKRCPIPTPSKTLSRQQFGLLLPQESGRSLRDLPRN